VIRAALRLRTTDQDIQDGPKVGIQYTIYIVSTCILYTYFWPTLYMKIKFLLHSQHNEYQLQNQPSIVHRGGVVVYL
jgi:hypothetical protein